MSVTEREYVALQKSIDDNHRAIMDMLELRRVYFDNQFSELCRNIKDMKYNCTHTQDQCLVVFKDHDRRIRAITDPDGPVIPKISRNATDIARIKSVGATLLLLWGAVVTLASHILRKIGG